MQRIDLSHPIQLAGREITFIEIRTPGRAAFERITAVADPTLNEAIRHVSRLSGASEATIRKLHPADLRRVLDAVQEEIAAMKKAMRARKAQSRNGELK